MANSTLLQIVSQFCIRTGIPQPLLVVSSQDPQIQQIAGLLQEELEEVTLDANWEILNRQALWTTVAGEDQGPMATICGTPYVTINNDTFWNRTTRLPLFGPLDDVKWQQYKAMPYTGTLAQYRIKNDHLFIYPELPVGHQLAFEFSRQFCVVAADGVTYKNAPTADTDTFVFPDSHMIAAIRWRWKREKGQPYAEDKARWDKIVGTLKMRDGTKKILRQDGGYQDFQPGILVPSGNWPVT